MVYPNFCVGKGARKLGSKQTRLESDRRKLVEYNWKLVSLISCHSVSLITSRITNEFVEFMTQKSFKTLHNMIWNYLQSQTSRQGVNFASPVKLKTLAGMPLGVQKLRILQYLKRWASPRQKGEPNNTRSYEYFTMFLRDAKKSLTEVVVTLLQIITLEQAFCHWLLWTTFSDPFTTRRCAYILMLPRFCS